MGGCRCSFRNCKSATKYCDNIHFFHYPVKNRSRCKQWIENARKPDFFDLPEDQLRNKVVCELHFENRCFTNASRKRLLHDAVPTLRGNCEEDNINEENYEQQIFNNIQVLPANADGTIFTVDTEGMQQICDSDEIDTYVYKNGVLTPVSRSEAKFYHDDETIFYTMSEDAVHGNESSNSGIIENMQQEIGEESQSSNLNIHVAHELSNVQGNFYKIYTQDSPPNQKQNNISCESVCKESGIICQEIEISSNEECSNISTNIENQKSLKTRKCGQRIMKKLKQHDHEIRKMKHIMKANINFLPRKQKINIALQVLKQSVPKSLYQIFFKTLKKRSSSESENNDFFKKLYLTSPKAYQLLKENNWEIPDVNEQENLNDLSDKGIQTEVKNLCAQSSQTSVSENQSAKGIQTLEINDEFQDNEVINQSTISVGTQYFSENDTKIDNDDPHELYHETQNSNIEIIDEK